MTFYTPDRDKHDDAAAAGSAEGVPRVLILGDSISQGYTWLVRDRLEGVCVVDRPRANCGDTRAGLENLDAWTVGGPWDLIHFNWGLHDLCHRHPDSELYGNRDKVKGEISVPLDQYRENLETLVTRLLGLAPRLLWASTTVVPPEEGGRFEGDELRYNAVAAEVMAQHDVPMNDLHALTAGFDTSMFTAPGDVHFAEAGIAQIADQVAMAIRSQIRPR